MFKQLPSNENYCVSDCGEIFSVKKNKILSNKINHDGYLRIQIWKDSRCSFVSVHRLVAETFIPNPDDKPFVNHKDGNKSNNCVDNLEWCTQQENIVHAWSTGLSKSHINNRKMSLPVDQYTRTGEFIATFPSQMEVERCLGINHAIISACCSGRRKEAGGFIWIISETSND